MADKNISNGEKISGIKISQLGSTSELNDKDLFLIAQYDGTKYISRSIDLSSFVKQIEEKIYGNIGVLTFYRNPSEGIYATSEQTYRLGQSFTLKTIEQLGWKDDDYEFKYWEDSNGHRKYNGDSVTVTDKTYELSGVWEKLRKPGVIYFNSNYSE